MFKCWYVDPKERPKFSELVSSMSQTLENLASYAHLSAFSKLEAHNGPTFIMKLKFMQINFKSKLYFHYIWYSIVWKLKLSTVGTLMYHRTVRDGWGFVYLPSITLYPPLFVYFLAHYPYILNYRCSHAL